VVKIPNNKHQITNKFQTANANITSDLDIEISDLNIIWDLRFGV
jgi:hypothetical protein